jgi:hypothetical protein
MLFANVSASSFLHAIHEREIFILLQHFGLKTSRKADFGDMSRAGKITLK